MATLFPLQERRNGNLCMIQGSAEIAIATSREIEDKRVGDGVQGFDLKETSEDVEHSAIRLRDHVTRELIGFAEIDFDVVARVGADETLEWSSDVLIDEIEDRRKEIHHLAEQSCCPHISVFHSRLGSSITAPTLWPASTRAEMSMLRRWCHSPNAILTSLSPQRARLFKPLGSVSFGPLPLTSLRPSNRTGRAMSVSRNLPHSATYSSAAAFSKTPEHSSKILLVLFDVFDTLLFPREPPHVQYVRPVSLSRLSIPRCIG